MLGFDWQEAVRACGERLLLPVAPMGHNCATRCQDCILQFLMHLYYTNPAIAPEHRINFICLYPNQVGAHFKWKTHARNEWTAAVPSKQSNWSLAWRTAWPSALLCGWAPKCSSKHNKDTRSPVKFPFNKVTFIIFSYWRGTAGGSFSVPPRPSASLFHTLLVSAQLRL